MSITNGIALREACDEIGRDTIIKLAQELCYARRRHPGFASDYEDACCVVKGEMLEWQAKVMQVFNCGEFSDERRKKAEAEAWHVIATALRYIGREYEAQQDPS